MSEKKTRDSSVLSCCCEAINFFWPNRSLSKLYLRCMASNLSRHHDFKLALPGVNRVPTGQPRAPHATTRAIFFKEFSTPIHNDNDKPRATSADIARYHWQRMFSLPRLIEFNRQVGTYWLKDDHDTLNDDSWPGRSMGSFTFAEGQKIFRQQAPMADGRSYRTFRWGRDLQIWLTDGRDFRSPNNTADGPEKTIWGKEQKAWFKRTTMESDATWKILISPTPMVGPDRPGKNDNHSNGGFKSEGDELREWFGKNLGTNFFVICGDRHWQYHSVHPETGLHEFSVGPASDEHAGGSPGVNPAYHRFHRVKGGFLSTTLKRVGDKRIITFQHHDIDGKVVHEWSTERNIS